MNFIILCILISTDLLAQSKDDRFSHYNQLILAGDTMEAIVELERIAFLDDNLAYEAIFLKGILFKELNQFEQAQRCFERINLQQLSDSQHFSLRYQAALSAYQAGNYADAEAHILQIKQYISDSNYYYSILPLLALTLNEMNRWPEAGIILKDFIVFLSLRENIAKDSLLNIVEKMYNKRNIPKLLRVRKAQLMSAIIPGSGQIYAGYFWEGLANFSFSLTSLAVGVYAFYEKYYFTGYFVGLGLFQKFYFGGQKRTEVLVNNRNNIKINRFNRQATEFILSIK